MLSYGVVKPGVAHPPPLLGEGDRDNDINDGVPGILGNGWAKPLAGSPDEAPGRFFDECCSCTFSGDGMAFAADEDRRRRCDPVDTWVADGEARLRMQRRFGKHSTNAG